MERAAFQPREEKPGTGEARAAEASVEVARHWQQEHVGSIASPEEWLANARVLREHAKHEAESSYDHINWMYEKATYSLRRAGIAPEQRVALSRQVRDLADKLQRAKMSRDLASFRLEYHGQLYSEHVTRLDELAQKVAEHLMQNGPSPVARSAMSRGERLRGVIEALELRLPAGLSVVDLAQTEKDQFRILEALYLAAGGDQRESGSAEVRSYEDIRQLSLFTKEELSLCLGLIRGYVDDERRRRILSARQERF